MRSFIFIALYLCRACSARSLRWACASRSTTRRRSPVADATIITRRHDITHRTNISLIIYFNNATSLWQPANNVHHRWRTAPIFLLLYSFSITRGKQVNIIWKEMFLLFPSFRKILFYNIVFCSCIRQFDNIMKAIYEFVFLFNVILDIHLLFSLIIYTFATTTKLLLNICQSSFGCMFDTFVYIT